MATIKKNKIHNPQFITDPVPENVTSDDYGRLWVDKSTNKLAIAVTDENGDGKIIHIMDSIDNAALTEITSKFFSEVSDEYTTIIAQTNGDKHYDTGYDFFSDPTFINDITQDLEDYYSFFYVEVPSVDTVGYLRTINLEDGTTRKIRPAIGSDNYIYNSITEKVVRYSKITLSQQVKNVIEIKFDNKDVIESGFELLEDGQTILIYCDPEGFFLNKTVKVRYLV